MAENSASDTTTGNTERINPKAANPHEILANYPELLHHEMIGAWIRDHRTVEYWNPVHFDPELQGVVV